MKVIILGILKNCTITAVLSILMGLVLIIVPAMALKAVCYLLGSILLLYGAIRLIRYFSGSDTQVLYRHDFILGLTCAATALFFLFKSDTVLYIIPSIFGLIVIIRGIVDTQNALDLKHESIDKWWVVLLLASASIILGVLLLSNPFTTIVTMVSVIGLILIYQGIADILVVHFLFSGNAELKRFLADWFA